MYLLGLDIGSSSVKAALVLADTGECHAVVQSPQREMSIEAPRAGWAEQDPEQWWKHVCNGIAQLFAQTMISPETVAGIGIAYQMHGLVVVDKEQQVLRPSIIWCDSRAVDIGQRALESIGPGRCFAHLLNSPGNFTASKLKWVAENEPALFDRIYRFMLPGDYIAMRLTGRISTTVSGLSEGVLWDFEEGAAAHMVLEEYGISPDLLPEVLPTFGIQGKVNAAASAQTGLPEGIPVSYRAGDQPNNALALNVLEPGEVAATGGTSGVVYGVVDQLVRDEEHRVNSFAHINHNSADPRIGLLLCINGAGSQYRWLHQEVAGSEMTYEEMETMASAIPPGAEGLRILPFGNGAERMLQSVNYGARILNLQFNLHQQAHLFRAGLEGVAFAFVHGMQVLRGLGLDVQLLRAGNDNLFQSPVFSQTLSNLMNCRIELLDSTGAIGAARAAGVATGFYADIRTAVEKQKTVYVFEPQADIEAFQAAYQLWEKDLQQMIGDS